MFKHFGKYFLTYCRGVATLNSNLPTTKQLWDAILKKPYLAINNASEFCINYNELTKSEKQDVMQYIAIKFGVDGESVKTAASSFLKLQSEEPDYTVNVLERLRSSLRPKYDAAFSSISALNYGIKFLVDFRADVQEFILERNVEENVHFCLRALSTHLKTMLSYCFNIGLLSLERITWTSPCHVLQKISEYEGVHPIRNWADLKQRVGPYRRCYVFTHGSMPLEPIVMLHVALTEDISSSINSIVTRCVNQAYFSSPYVSHENIEDKNKIKAAVFYSITSSQKGLQGIELGSKLIKQVVKEIMKEFPHILKFSSLSPIPGFRDWLLLEFSKAKEGNGFLKKFFSEQHFPLTNGDMLPSGNSFWKYLGQLLSSNRWVSDASMAAYLEEPLLKLCAHYLFNEKRRSYALNSVAHFHLQNGAVMWRLNWAADVSPRGLDSSCGMMVNYRYFIQDTEHNSERYIQEFKIEISDSVKILLVS